MPNRSGEPAVFYPPGVPRRLKHWGWGYEDEQLTVEQTRAAAAAIRDRLGFGSEEPE